MKLNNKGITLVELIVSIALISIIIMFLFRLLVDVRYTDNNTDFNRENQQARSIILKTIQKDLLEKKLNSFSVGASDTSAVSINLTFKNGLNEKKAQIIVTQDSLTYKNDENVTEKWALKNENGNAKFDIQCIRYFSSIQFQDLSNPDEFFYIRFTIPVVMNSKKKNYIDDLEFFYLGETKDIDNIEKDFSFNNNVLKNYDDQCG